MKNLCDMHAHLLPGIDDGAQDWDMTMKMLRKAYKAGVNIIIATPHNLPWEKPTDPQKIRDLCAQATDKAAKEGMKMIIGPGQELYFHTGLMEELEKGRALTLAGTVNILVEFDPREPYGNISGGLFRLVREGFVPVLAHAERYACLREKNRIEDLIGSGIRIQINSQSFEKSLFSERGRWVKKQIAAHHVHCVGSDMHNLTSRPPFRQENLETIGKWAGKEYAQKLLNLSYLEDRDL